MLVLLLFSGTIYTTEQQALLSQLDRRLDARLRQLAVAYAAGSGRLAAAPDADVAQGNEVVLLLAPGGRVVQTQAAGQLSSKAPWNEVARALVVNARSDTPIVVEQALMLAIPGGTTKDGRPATTIRAGLFRLTGMPLTARQRHTALLVVGLRSDVPGQMASLARTLGTVAPR